MSAFWLTFRARPAGCVEATDKEAALAIGAVIAGEAPVSCDVLPYPANPRLNKIEHTDNRGEKYIIPSFCYDPHNCKGRSSCPKRRACDD